MPKLSHHLRAGLLGCIAAAILLAGPLPTATADPPLPQISFSPSPAVTPAAPLRPAGAVKLSGLKAVLIVGDIDGPTGPSTTYGKVVMDLAAAELAANGVTVHKFYTPANAWAQITTAAAGAHFLLYRGHGVYWSSLPNPTVGGFYLKGNEFISPDTIRRDLHLAANAVVIMSGACFASGSSSVAGDAIDSREARRRVAQYSDPFFDVGAGGYLSNWYSDAPQMFIRYLFAGMTLRQTYETFFDYNAGTVQRYAHPDHPTLVMWLDHDTYSGVENYNHAFAGRPNRTLQTLFGGAATPTPASRVYLPLVI